MICPFCETVNRSDRETCYHCDRDLSMLRLVVNKAKHHYNLALEHAERERYEAALSELRNALDLHSDFPAAHVVLGSIYARMEQFEDAKLAWEAALSLDHNQLKAYRYLEKLERVREQTPTIRRLKILAGACAAIAVVALLFLLGTLKPDHEFNTLGEAVDAHSKGNLAAATKGFASLVGAKSTSVDDTAKQWLNIIEREYEQTRREIDFHMQTGDLDQARKRLVAARSRQNTDTVKSELTLLANALNDAYFVDWEDLVKRATDGDASLDELRQRAEDLQGVFQNDSQRLAAINRAVDELEGSGVEVLLSRIKEQHIADRNLPATRKRLEQLIERYADFKPAVAWLEDITNEEFKILLRQGEEALKDGDLANARKSIAQLDSLQADGHVESWKESIDTLRDDLLDAMATMETARIKAITLHDVIADSKVFEIPEELDGSKRKSIEALVLASRRRVATEFVDKWMVPKDWPYRTVSITTEQALITAQMAPLAKEYYPKWGHDKILLYEGSAYLRLGQPEAADAAFAELRKRFPLKNAYVGFIDEARRKAALRRQ